MNSSTHIDQQLARRIKRGDVLAFDQLYERYSQRLYGFAFSMLKNREDAKEIVQETFLKIWNKRTTIDGSHALRSFLFSVSYNLMIDLFRQRTKDQDFMARLKDHFNEESIPADELVQLKELTDEVHRLVNELPRKRRTIYLMSREEGLSHKEIAEKLGITEKTVENQITLSLKHIRSRLNSGSLLTLLFLSLFV
ncbi:RNA polymerase sigma-70 factor [uncultured Sunxiuqinia sp.]|uniref:RNA polymerase sigma factor n=1 Tax=uncultured Sunxiuqinia sp. TaxID=1573825 RepID=UPI0019C7904C|nr:RNA polymerase sigma-70 factor [Sunxiuqinia sp.]|tara:strand:+ start:875 stop:1459 length:585 start_codon:yes stop_codon:yes gene_type:complete